MENLKMHTPDLAEENFRKLAAMFPNAVTETINEDGEVVRAIDADVLRQEISATVVEGAQDRYQFTWPDKKKSVVLANQPIAKTLRLDREKSVGRDGTPGSIDTENIYIEGDNLDVLKLLQETYLGKVKVIYIDPPYNTGSDFIYEDDFSLETEEYLGNSGQFDEEGNRLVQNTESNGRFHTDWLNMLYPRLRIAKDLLAEDGAIFVSIDEHEHANLVRIMSEIFGSENYIDSIVWDKKASAKGVPPRNMMVNVHEYIVCYSKQPLLSVAAPLSEEEIKKYKMKDDKFEVRGGFITQPLATRSKDDRPNLVYPVYHNGVEIYPDKQWIWEKSRLYQAIENDEVVFSENSGKWSVRFKQYLKDENGVMRLGKPISILTGPYNQDGTKEIETIFGKKVFNNPKPKELIKYLLSFVFDGKDDKDGIYLDSFGGSGTTAHAVLDLNRDGGNRKFILVEMGDYADSITAERVKRVIRGYGEGKNAVEGTGGNFSFYDLGEPLLVGDCLNEAVAPEKIREYIWFMETKQPYAPPSGGNPYYLGQHNNTGYYFYYEPQRVTVLDYTFLATITEKTSGTIIYADRSSITEDKLAQMGIVFKKIPRDISRL